MTQLANSSIMCIKNNLHMDFFFFLFVNDQHTVEQDILQLEIIEVYLGNCLKPSLAFLVPGC